MKVLAKDAKAGQWYRSEKYGTMLCCMGLAFWTPLTETVDVNANDELTHLPDCDGWDWQPPKPEKKYRAFATWQEWWPHRDRWVRIEEDLIRSAWGSPSLANEYLNLGATFLHDDGTDAEPFGVEVTK